MPANQRPVIPPPPLVELGIPGDPVIPPPGGLGDRLAWAATFAGLLLLLAGEGWLFLAALDWHAAGLAWLAFAALAGTGLALAVVGYGIRLAWRRDAYTAAASEDLIDTRLRFFRGWAGTILKTQAAYNARYYRVSTGERKRLIKVTNGRHTYWIDDQNRVWRAETGAASPPGDNTTRGLAGESAAPATWPPPSPAPLEATTRQLPTLPPLEPTAAAFLALIVAGRSFGSRAVVPDLLTRREYDSTIAAFLQAGILIRAGEGKAFSLPPALADWRAAYPGANAAYRADIMDRANLWARRLIAGQLEDA